MSSCSETSSWMGEPFSRNCADCGGSRGARWERRSKETFYADPESGFERGGFIGR